MDVPPKLRRRLFRLSALLELADEELDEFVREVKENVKEYTTSLTKGDQEVEINVDSLRAYIQSSPEVKYWNTFLRTDSIVGHPVDENDWGDLSRDVRIANSFGLKTLDDIEETLKKAHGWGENFLRSYLQATLGRKADWKTVRTVVNGSVTMLLLASNVEKLDEEKLRDQFGFGTAAVFLQLAEQVRRGHAKES
jgi:putative GTP pyrophosphokinase